MIEHDESIKSKENLPANGLLVIGQPQMSDPPPIGPLKFPSGYEDIAISTARQYCDQNIRENELRKEYIDIANTLIQNNIPFRFLAANPNNIDQTVGNWLLGKGVRGVFLPTPSEVANFPRDIMTEINGTILINPSSHIEPRREYTQKSLFGEGGRTFFQDNILFVASVLGSPQELRAQYEKDIKNIPSSVKICTLPPPECCELNLDTFKADYYLTEHLDRSMALIKGKDQNLYLLAEQRYVNTYHPKIGQYSKIIESQCKQFGIKLISIPHSTSDIPYCINMLQLDNGKIVMSPGNSSLDRVVKDIVGSENVYHTQNPVLSYPIFKCAGIHCLIGILPNGILKTRN